MKKKSLNPVTKIVLMYVLFVVVGGIILQMNILTRSGENVTLLEGFFTSASSFATTGLSLFDYNQVYNTLGCLVLIIFFNIGGMGIMTLNTIFYIIIGKKIGFQNRVLAKIDLNKHNTDGLVQLTKTIILMFLIVEFIGTALIFLKIGYMNFSLVDRFMNSWFMAASAITGSGFFNTIPYSRDFFVLAVLIVLMIFSFIGYPVIMDFLEFIKHKFSNTRRKYKFSNFTKISVGVNLITLLMFAFIFFFLESGNTMQDNTLFEQVYYSIYISTSTKSVGLNVFTDITQFTNVTLLFSIVFMIIGGAPSSACGGIRVTTIYVIYIYIKSQIQGKSQAIYGQNYVSEKTVLKAYNVTFIFLLLAFVGFILILLFNSTENLFYLFYDVISAITTTGFSTGALASLNNIGIIIMTVLMFIGRIGVINLIMAINFRKKGPGRVGYVEKDIII